MMVALERGHLHVAKVLALGGIGTLADLDEAIVTAPWQIWVRIRVRVRTRQW